jgi:hypothetical protein
MYGKASSGGPAQWLQTTLPCSTAYQRSRSLHSLKCSWPQSMHTAAHFILFPPNNVINSVTNDALGGRFARCLSSGICAELLAMLLIRFRCTIARHVIICSGQAAMLVPAHLCCQPRGSSQLQTRLCTGLHSNPGTVQLKSASRTYNSTIIHS